MHDKIEAQPIVNKGILGGGVGWGRTPGKFPSSFLADLSVTNFIF